MGRISSSVKTTRVQVTRVFRENLKSRKPIVINIGGARSTKSHSLAQLFIQLASEKVPGRRGLDLAIVRKTMPALRKTAMRLTIGLLKEYGLYDQDHHNMSEHWYELNGNRIQFMSLDDTEKIKSMEFHFVWLEEMSEFTLDDFLIIQTRMSGPKLIKRPNQIFGSLNPDDANSWIRVHVMPRKDVQTIHSTYEDNPFLDLNYIKILEGLKEQDINAWRVYAKGLWGKAQHLIYLAWTTVNQLPKSDDVVWGLDFGFNNPTALIETRLCDDGLYHKEHIYETHLTTPDLITKMEEIIPEDRRSEYIFADSAEPDRIKEICDAGFNCMAADKAVNAGIDSVKRYKEHITTDSPNMIKEQQTYQWRRDRNGNVLDIPVKFNDHAMDAKRYGMHSYLKEVGPVVTSLTRTGSPHKSGLEMDTEEPNLLQVPRSATISGLEP